MDWTSESEENDDFQWESEEDADDPTFQPPSTTLADTGRDAVAGPSREDASTSRGDSYSVLIGMGFLKEDVEKAINENAEGDTEVILEALLCSKTARNCPSEKEDSSVNFSLGSDDDLSDGNISGMDDFEDEGFTDDAFDKDRKVASLVEMGFTADEASAALDRCGLDASICELSDSIHAARLAEEDFHAAQSSTPSPFEDSLRKSNLATTGKKRMWVEESRQHKRSRFEDQKKQRVKSNALEDDDGPRMLSILPSVMVGFSLPNQRVQPVNRMLPAAAMGPPYFYYENVALAPKGVWDTISRFLYDIEPEFVDSKHFCAAARKRAYVHNLPIEGRFPLLPLPPRTINEALPMTKKWWPPWDPRTHLNCLQTCIASAKLTEKIRYTLSYTDGTLNPKVQKFVLEQCRKWNLVWVGLHKVAPLEPDEIEMLLGFPKDHTRGGGISRTERYRSLGNSFQVDTVAYHLSVLKNKFPSGMTVLSLFSGIGGAEVALHRLGIHLKAVVSVELSEVNRNIIRGWWEQTNQSGTLIEIADVQHLTPDKLEKMIHTFGGFDLVIGGSPCNNLAGSNRYSRDGLEGKQSSLFFDYFRILEHVKNLMGNN